MIYLNNAATSFPKPHTVIEAVNNCLQQIPNEPGRVNAAQTMDILSLCRYRIGEFFQIEDLNRIILTPGSTYSLNYVIHGLARDHSKAHCITSVIEHNSVFRPLNHLAKDNNLSITYLTPAEIFDLQSVKTAIKSSTRFIVLNQASNVTGTILPIQEIAQLCAELEIPIIIDASQSAGSMEINVKEMPGNLILVFTGHKGLMGPPGTGGFYIGPEVKLFEPILQGGTGIRSDLLFQPNDLPIYYEAGTMNLPGFAGLAEGIRFVREVGVSTIGRHKQRLLTHLKDLIKPSDALTIYEPLDNNYTGGVFSFSIRDWKPDDIGQIFQESYDIIVRTGLHCAPLIHQHIGSWPKGTVRVSCSWFTTEQEIEKAGRVINQLLRSK